MSTAPPTEGSAESAMVALFAQVMQTAELFSACMAYQDGVKTALYEDGDVASANGHLSLLRLRRALRRMGKGKRSEGEAGAGSTSCIKAGASGSCSLSTTNSTRSAKDRTSSNTVEVSEVGKQASVAAEEGYADGNEGDAKQDEGVPLLEDLRFSQLAVDWAAAQGHLAVVRWLLENRGEGCTESAVDGACWNGHEETVRWLMCEWRQPGSERALDYAASTGRFELVKWLSRQRGSRCTVAAMDGAAGGGYLEVVRWLAANRREGCSAAAFELASAAGHLDVITLDLDRDLLTSSATHALCAMGLVDRLPSVRDVVLLVTQWLDEAGFLCCSSAGWDNAAEGGHLHVLKWLLEHSAEYMCSTNSYGLAASRGRVEVCKWLRETLPNLRCPVWAAETAAAAGHLEVVSWLDASGLCRASLANLDEVAGQGQLRAIIWLSDRGSRASTLAVDRAAIAGHADVVDYLLRNRHEGCSPEALVGAARRGHLAVVKLLRELRPEQCGCCLTARAVAAAAGHSEVARWLDESDPELLRALEAAVVSESSTHGGDSSSSSSSSSSTSSGGDEGSADQAANDDEMSFFSALGSSKSSSTGDGRPNNRAGESEASLFSDLSSRNSERREDADGTTKVDEGVSEVHAGDQARGRGIDDEVMKATPWTGLGGILRQAGETLAFLLGASVAAVFLFMIAIEWSPSLLTRL